MVTNQAAEVQLRPKRSWQGSAGTSLRLSRDHRGKTEQPRMESMAGDGAMPCSPPVQPPPVQNLFEAAVMTPASALTARERRRPAAAP